MAVEKDLNDDKQTNSEPLAASATPLAGDSGASPSGNGSGTATTAPTPSGRPNVQQYLNANQGAGQQLSQGIQDAYGKQVEQVNKTAGDAKSKLDDDVNPMEKSLGDENAVKTAFKDPSKILADQSQTQNFQKLASGGYNDAIHAAGDNFQTQTNQLQNQLGTLNSQVGLANTEAGRFQLLNQSLNHPNYTRGQQKLDQLFLQNQPGVASGLAAGLQNQYNNAAQNISGISAEAQARLQALQGLSGQRQQQWQDLLKNGTSGNLEADINDRGLSDIEQDSESRLASAQIKAQEALGIQNRLQDPANLTKNDLRNLGLNDLTLGDSTWGINLNDYLADVDQTPSLAGAADPQEFARYQALQQLSGNANPNKFGNATTAGGWTPYTYNAGAAQQAVNDARHKYLVDDFNKAMAPLKNPGPDNSGYSYFTAAPGSNDEMQSIINSTDYNSLYNSLMDASRNQLIDPNYNPDGGDHTYTAEQVYDRAKAMFPGLADYLDEVKAAQNHWIGHPLFDYIGATSNSGTTNTIPAGADIKLGAVASPAPTTPTTGLTDKQKKLYGV
jgi:hypothetical protein